MQRKATMFPFEYLDNAVGGKHTISAAKSIVSDGWSRRGYRTLRLDQPIPWELASESERSWNFHIHSLDMIDALLRAHSQEGDVGFLRAALPVALDWIWRHSDRECQGLSPFAWYDMSVGMRAYRLAYLLDAGRAVGLLKDDEEQALWNSLEQHAAYLAEDANIAFHTNHGYYQVAGQIAMGRRFAHESTAMAQALEQGRVRLKRMLDQQFAADGVHREHSPDYHRMVYDTLKALIDAGLVEDECAIVRAEGIERALAWFVLPNVRLANFGDSDYRSMLRVTSEAERKWQTAEMRFAASGGKTGQRFAKTWEAFSSGGYFVVRKPAAAMPDDPKQDSYLAQAAAFHSRTHKHADDLTFLWHDRGSDLIVDAGRYGYIGKAEQGSDLWLDGHWYADPNRVYCESTRAHNTLEFDGKNYPRKTTKPYGSALKRWVEAKDGVIAVETECKQFGSIRHARVLAFLPAQWLLVFDWFHDNNERTHDVKQWFHLAPELQLNPVGEDYVVYLPTTEVPLQITSLLEEPRGSRPFIGEEEPVRQGWWSAKERDIVPNYAFCYEQTGTRSGVFATLFSFSAQIAADRMWSKVNVSGRRGQFRWKDETGTHELLIDRPAEGDLGITYSVREIPSRTG